MLKNRKIYLSIAVILGTSISGAFLFAWTSPTGDPAPANNTNPPIYNAGSANLPAIDAGSELTIVGDLTVEGETRLGNYANIASAPTCDVNNLGVTLFAVAENLPYVCVDDLAGGYEWSAIGGCPDCLAAPDPGEDCVDNSGCSSLTECINGYCDDPVYATRYISSCEELQNIGNGYNLPYHLVLGNYELTQDIDCSGRSFLPIGGDCDPQNKNFMTLNGNGYVIRNLTIKKDSMAGLFKCVYKVKNLGIENLNLEANTYAGGIAYSADLIENSYVTGQIGPWYSDNLFGAAGLVYLGGDVSNSHADVDIDCGTHCSKVGGLVGELSGAISNSYATGNIVTKTAYVAGGLVGEALNNSSIEYSYATGELNIGINEGAIGGLVGIADTYIKNSYASGNVLNGKYVGGLIGATNGYSRCTIENSYAMGSVSGETAGGLVGVNVFSLISIGSYATNNVVGSLREGGLVGYMQSGSFSSTYYTGQNACGYGRCSDAIRRTPTQMKLESTYSGWDFINIWKLDSIQPNINDYYPCLRWQDDSTCPLAP